MSTHDEQAKACSGCEQLRRLIAQMNEQIGGIMATCHDDASAASLERAEARNLVQAADAELQEIDAALGLNRPGKTRYPGDRAEQIHALRKRAHGSGEF